MQTQINKPNTAAGDSVIKSSHNLRFYFNLLARNKIPILLSLGVGLIASYFYAMSQMDIYSSASSLKLTKPKENVLEGKVFSDLESELPERFINNEVEILRSFAIREKTARYLLDSFENYKNKSAFYVLCETPSQPPQICDKAKSIGALAGALAGVVEVSQKRGLDIVTVKAESPVPLEATLIANCYAQAYADYSLKSNRNHLTLNREFLENQVQEKYNELLKSEENLTNFLRRENIVELGTQSSALINGMATIESQYNEAVINSKATSEALESYKKEFDKLDPEAVEFLESKVTDPYINELQSQIAKLEIQRDLIKTGNESIVENSKPLKEYELKIAELKKNLAEKVDVLKRGATSNTPEERRTLAWKLLDSKVSNDEFKIREKMLRDYLSKYEARFNKLPEQTIEYANLERTRKANEKVYLMLLEKYQEALINEESQPNNVKIIDYGKVPKSPSKPNRPLIVIIGLIIGIAVGYAFVLVRNILDVSVKTPEELENVGISLIGWVPTFMRTSRNGRSIPSGRELILAYNADSAPAESFRTLRTRLQFAKLEPEPIKSFLITSSIPREGKTLISANLAASFALSSKVLLLDCDFRKPRLHNIFNQKRYPGLCDYLFGTVSFDEIVRKTQFENLTFVSCGTIPPNPSELIASKHMQNFINSMKPKYDYIIIDSPPLATVTDAELLSSYVDGTVVVSLANKTRMDLLISAIETLNRINDSFIGVVLNNFDYQATYGSYYKYYYYYYGASEKDKSKKSEVNRRKDSGKESATSQGNVKTSGKI